MKFVLIPAGSFMMGSKASLEETIGKYISKKKYSNDEHPQHKVTITKPFYLQSTQVTQGQWKRVMGNNPSQFKKWGDACPVEWVSWDDAQEFTNKLNESEGSDKYRLPTEAEWEYACRAGTTSEFFFGDDAGKLREYAWYGENSKNKTHPVGQKKPNSWGLYDMHGNVWEWCQDWFGDYPSNSVADPKGPAKGNTRVLRGGSWFYDLDFARCAFRFGSHPYLRDFLIGFRCVRILK